MSLWHEPEDLTLKLIHEVPRTPGNWRLWDVAGVGHLFLLGEGRVHGAWPSVGGGKCWLEVGPLALY